ncbi:MAG: hypothetical protein MZW92_74950 [Comamonadaceae bacterium]|nr:hypothetical protein [Comamonadaceae bacterium]
MPTGATTSVTLGADAHSARAALVVDAAGPAGTARRRRSAVHDDAAQRRARRRERRPRRRHRRQQPRAARHRLQRQRRRRLPGDDRPVDDGRVALPAGGALVFAVRAAVNAGAADGVVVNQLSATAAADTDRADSSAIAQATVRTPRSGVSVTVLSAPAAPVPPAATSRS